MERFLSQFTLIDFLGIFMPGGMIVLSFRVAGIDLSIPAVTYFGDNSFALGFYFVFLSYIMGLFIMESSDWLTGILFSHNNPCVALLQGKNCSQPYYKKIKFEILRRYKLNIENESVHEEVYWLIYQYILKEGHTIKLMLFNGFYILFRNFAAVCILLCPIILYQLYQGNQVNKFILYLLGSVLLPILLYRKAVKFKKLAVATIYAEFINLCSN